MDQAEAFARGGEHGDRSVLGGHQGGTMRYDPDVGPDSTPWLELDEAGRLAAVRQYHKRAKGKATSPMRGGA